VATQGKLLPFYVVVDVSYSMKGTRIDQANEILPEVADTLRTNPILEDKIRVGLIDFSDDAKVVLPLCNLSEQKLPSLSIRGGTNYGAAFSKLRSEIERDVTQLQSDGFQVHRPAVFFLSDGEPGDNWKPAFTSLVAYDREADVGFKWYPNVIPFGVGEAQRETLQELVHPVGRSKLYMVDDNQSGGQAIAAMAEILIGSIMASGRDGGGLILPDADEVPDGVSVHDGPDWLS
jgi:uncharacterized protein YegL